MSARAEAERMLAEHPQAPRGIWTDSQSKPGVVIVGIAVRGIGSCAIAIDRAEYDALALLELIECTAA